MIGYDAQFNQQVIFALRIIAVVAFLCLCWLVWSWRHR